MLGIMHASSFGKVWPIVDYGFESERVRLPSRVLTVTRSLLCVAKGLVAEIGLQVGSFLAPMFRNQSLDPCFRPLFFVRSISESEDFCVESINILRFESVLNPP